MNRRSFLQNSAAAGLTVGAALTLPACATRPSDAPINAARANARLAAGNFPWAGLATSMTEEVDQQATLEGSMPSLRGTLYRNGPGLFERGGMRKRSLLDGDGMIRCWQLAADGARFRNRFVRTEKFDLEEAEDRFAYATWTTQAPGGRIANLFGSSMGNQAGVSVHEKGGELFAFDESSLPHVLDPETLQTKGTSRMGVPDDTPGVFAAHPKTDGQNGDWVHFGLAYGRSVTLNVTDFDRSGRFTGHRSWKLPRYAYLHDFFLTENYLVFNVHPANFEISKFLFGSTSLVGSLRWQPEQGNLFWVLPRRGDGEPIAIEADAHWMWHVANAYERSGPSGTELVLDYVGHDAPSAFIGEDPGLFAVMQGRVGEGSVGTFRRATIDLASRSVRVETLSSESHEFPMVHPVTIGHRHRRAVLTRDGGDFFATQLVAYDVDTGSEEVCDFGNARYCTEPVVAPDPEHPNDETKAWILSEVYDGGADRSFLAILRADAIADGPVAELWLDRGLPLSLHGVYSPA